ncbi:MAG: hypothetical protein V6006_00515 [Candidatus Dasytiphilus stammeri]
MIPKLTPEIHLHLLKQQLRYGEHPHQQAALLYVNPRMKKKLP